MDNQTSRWTDLFLSHVRQEGVAAHVSEDEGYKFRAVDTFQRFFDLEAVDLEGMFDKAIEPNNLVMGAMYFPRKMLLTFARDYAEETRAIFRDLYDESKDAGVRLTQAMSRFDELLGRRLAATGGTGSSYMGLRFLSLMLSYRYPEKYNAMKPREWKVFCRFVDDTFAIPNHTPIGEQYVRFSEHIDALIAYIKTVPAINEIRQALTKGQGLAFADEGYRWMAQDVIYVTARHLAGERDAEKPSVPSRQEPDADTEEDIDTTTQEDAEEGAVGRFPLEQHLERFMVANWDQIDFGEPLSLYRDEDGTPGEQYTTDVGIIDLLATDAKGDFVIIELKRGKSTQHVVGQILAYMGWVRRNLATNGQGVRGVVIASDSNAALDEALKEVGDKVIVLHYRVHLELLVPVQK
jgi:hypothetical protein